jgi:hypothetical protein
VRGRLSTQQIRTPGKANAEPNPEPAAQDKGPGLLSRLRAVPGFLRELPSSQRRRVLLLACSPGWRPRLSGWEPSPVLSSSEARPSPVWSGPARRIPAQTGHPLTRVSLSSVASRTNLPLISGASRLESSRSRRGTSSRFPGHRTGNLPDRVPAAEPNRRTRPRRMRNPRSPATSPGREKPRHPSKAPRRDAVWYRRKAKKKRTGLSTGPL